MVMTGGDPLKRADLFDLIRHASGKGLQLALTPSATPLATREAFEQRATPGFSAWASASTAPTPRRTTPFAAGKAASSGR